MDAKKPRQDGDNTFSRKLGAKQYELTDHLGNVVATIRDKKIHPQELVTAGSQNVDTTLGFQADVTGRYDYYPFGMEIQSRSGDFTNIDYTTDVNKLIYDGLLKSCNYYTTYPNNQGGQNGVEQCATAQNLYGQNYVSYYSIEDHTGSAYILEIKIRLSEVIPSLDGNGNYQIEVKLQQSRERNIVGTIGSHQAVVSSPGVGPGGNVIPFDEKLFTFNLTGDELTTAASGGKITLTLNFSQGLNGGFSPIIDVQSIRVLQNFKNTTVPLARRDEAAYTYGFQGMQRTDALAGSGNHYTAPNWEYSPRLGRRWNTDPVVYPWQSSYATFNNNPIYFKDPSGLQGIAFNGGGGDKKKGGGSTTSPQQPQIPKVDIKTVEVWADGPKKAGFFSRLWSGIKNFFTNAWNAFKKMDANIQGNGDPSGKGTHTLTGGTEINNSGVKGKEGNYINMEAWLIIGPRVGKAQPWRNTSVDNAVNAVGSASEAVQEYGAALGNSTDDDVKETSQENANNYHKKFKKVVSPDVVLYKTTNTNTGKKYYRKEEDGGSTHTIIDESTYNNYDLTEEEIK